MNRISRTNSATKWAAILSLGLWLSVSAGPAAAADQVIASWILGMTPVDVTINVGDTVSWPSVVIPHNVHALPNANDGTPCDTTGSVQIDAAGVASFTATTTGVFYFSCTILGHCPTFGMRVKVTVVPVSSVPVFPRWIQGVGVALILAMSILLYRRRSRARPTTSAS